ncbi:MAG: MFS transporter [Deferrisomatales bacterium]|nr:MFS transporter [Deferrisomatales bacterium]
MDNESRRQMGRTDWQGVVFGICLGALAGFQLLKLPPVLPLLTEAYGYGRVYAGALMSVYSVAGLLLSWFVGRTLGLRGPRVLLLAAFGCLVAGNILGLITPGNAPALLSSRLLEGIGFTVLGVVGGVVATTSASEAHRMLATALWATWIPVGQILGTVTAIPAVATGQWKPLWWGAVALTVAAAVWGRALAASGRPAFRAPARKPAPEGERPAAQPTGAANSSPLLLIATTFALWSMQFISFLTWLPIYLVEVQGLGAARAATVYLVPPVLIVAFNLLTGVLLRWGWPLRLLLGGSLAAQAAVWFLAPWTTGVASGVLSLATYGVTSGIIPTCLFALPAALPGSGGSVAKGFAALMTGRHLGVLVGPILLGRVIAFHNGWQLATPLFGAICMAALAAHWVLSRNLVRHRTERSDPVATRLAA